MSSMLPCQKSEVRQAMLICHCGTEKKLDIYRSHWQANSGWVPLRIDCQACGNVVELSVRLQDLTTGRSLSGILLPGRMQSWDAPNRAMA